MFVPGIGLPCSDKISPLLFHSNEVFNFLNRALPLSSEAGVMTNLCLLLLLLPKQPSGILVAVVVVVDGVGLWLIGLVWGVVDHR